MFYIKNATYCGNNLNDILSSIMVSQGEEVFSFVSSTGGEMVNSTERKMILGTNKTVTEFEERDFLYTYFFFLVVCGLNVHI